MGRRAPLPDREADCCGALPEDPHRGLRAAPERLQPEAAHGLQGGAGLHSVPESRVRRVRPHVPVARAHTRVPPDQRHSLRRLVYVLPAALPHEIRHEGARHFL